MSTEPNLDRNWGFNINMAGLQAPTGQGSALVPEGYYKGLVTDMYINADKNTGRVIIKLSLVDAGPYTGAVRTDGLNIPKDANDNVRYYWRGLAEAAGYTPAQLDAGEITIGVTAFKGKQVFFKYTPKEEGNLERQYEQVTYLAPAEWAQQKAGFDAQPAKPATGSALGVAPAAAVLTAAPTNALGGVVQGAALGGAAPAALGTAPASNVVSQNDVLAKLGLGGQANA
jgi:hypothetical protein